MERVANPEAQHCPHSGAVCPCQAVLPQGLLQLVPPEGVNERLMFPAQTESEH